MTDREKDKLLLEAKPRLLRRYMLLAAFSGLLGSGLTSVLQRAFAPPVIHRNSAVSAIYGQYLAMVIDRTRTTYCDLHPTRILFTNGEINGMRMPIILPINSTGNAWPVLGRQRFALLVAKISDIPPGNWNIETMAREQCTWIDALTGGKVIITTPVPVHIPSSVQTVFPSIAP